MASKKTNVRKMQETGKSTVEVPSPEAARIENVKAVLEHQAEIMRLMTDTGNYDLPGLVSSGIENVLRWSAATLDEAAASVQADYQKAA